MPAAVAIPLITAGVTGGAAVAGSAIAGRSANRSMRMQSDAANRAAEIEAKAASEALQFQREQEAQRRLEFDRVQQQNYQMYQEERDYARQQDLYGRGMADQQFAYNKEKDERRYKDLAPYRQFGIGAMAQLRTPVQNIPQSTDGSIGARVRR